MKTRIYTKASMSDGVIHCYEIDNAMIRTGKDGSRFIHGRFTDENLLNSFYRLGVDFFIAEFDAFETFNAERAAGIRSAERKLAKLSGLKAKVKNHWGGGK